MNAKLLNVSTAFRPKITINSQTSDGIAAFNEVMYDFVVAKREYTINDVAIAMAKRGWAFMMMIDHTILIEKHS